MTLYPSCKRSKIRGRNSLGMAWGQSGNEVTKSWNLLKIVPGIDPSNVLGNTSIRSHDRVLIQTSRHGHENEEQSSLHNQPFFVAFGVLYATHSYLCPVLSTCSQCLISSDTALEMLRYIALWCSCSLVWQMWYEALLWTAHATCEWKVAVTVSLSTPIIVG